MTNTPNWPRLGQTASSHVAQILAGLATWRLSQLPFDLGLPLAACLENQPTALLVVVADGDLAVTAAAMEPTLLDTRSDLLLIADETDPWFPPLCCIGIWRGGNVTWHQPLIPWLSGDQKIWLVPAHDTAIADGASAFQLVARYLKPEPMPWANESKRLRGLELADALLRERML